MNARTLSLDALATRAKIAVIVPATNTIVQPEMEAMRPAGVTNHVSRMLLPVRPYDDMQAYRQALETEKGNLEEALNLVLPCEPHAVAHGHSIHSFRGDRVRALAEQQRLEDMAGIPFITPSMAVLEGLKAIGDPKANHGLKAKGPISVAQFTPDEIMAGFKALDMAGVEAFVHVGTNLPVSALTPQIEAQFGKPLIGVNVATYWLALRRLGIQDPLPGFGLLAEQH